MRLVQFTAMTLLAFALTLPAMTHAASDLVVVINGETLTGASCNGGNCELALSGEHSNVKFLDNGGTAKIKATDGNPETLRLENVTIEAQTATEHVLTFYATYTQPPSTDPQNNQKVKYDRTADGSMMRGNYSAKNDKFTINGWVDDLQDTSGAFTVQPTQYKLVTCVIPNCPPANGNFSLATYTEFTDGFGGNRMLKIEIKFDAKNTGGTKDKLNIVLVELKGTTAAGGVDGSMLGIYDSYAEEYIIRQYQNRMSGGKSKPTPDSSTKRPKGK